MRLKSRMAREQVDDARDGPYYLQEFKWVSIDGLPYLIDEVKLRDYIKLQTGGEVDLDPEKHIHLFHSDRHPGRFETCRCFLFFVCLLVGYRRKKTYCDRLFGIEEIYLILQAFWHCVCLVLYRRDEGEDPRPQQEVYPWLRDVEGHLHIHRDRHRRDFLRERAKEEEAYSAGKVCK